MKTDKQSKDRCDNLVMEITELIHRLSPKQAKEALRKLKEEGL